MKNTKYVSVNALPAYNRVILFLFMFLGCILVRSSLDGDFYFLYSFGKYIANNGFPVKDVLSMHADMNIIVQQWLVDVLFYHVYEQFGSRGVVAIVYAVAIVYTILMYKLCKLVTDNFFLSVVVTMLSSILMSVSFMVTRPQIFTYLILLLLLYALEKYVRTRKVRWLCVLPLLSWIQINIHASMWLMLFVLMMPYVVSCVHINLPFYQEPARCKFVHLILTMVAMTAMALLNPYGHKALLYLVGSFGVENINENISEMQPVAVSEPLGIVCLGILFLMGFLMVIGRKRKPELRFICLALGTAVLGLTSYKAYAYFCIAGFVAFAHYFRDFDYSLKITEGQRTQKEKIRLAVLIVLLIGALGYLMFVMPEDKQDDSFAAVEQLEPAAAYLDTQDSHGMVLYAGFNEGAFLEFKGYKPYMDPRAEVFLKAKNGQFDYRSEYLKLISGKIHYRDFMDKYGFTHILVPTEENYLYVSLIRDADYEVGFTDENYTVFVSRSIM